MNKARSVTGVLILH